MKENIAQTGQQTQGIKVTKGMIESGLKVLEESGRLSGPPWGQLSSGDNLLVERLFLTMLSRCGNKYK